MARPDDKDDATMRARLETLSSEIEARRGEAGHPSPSESKAPVNGTLSAGMSLAFRSVSELVAGICVGGGLGWLLDRWLHTQPLFLIVLGLLGTVGGFWNLIRATMTPDRAKSVDFRDRLGATRRGTKNGDR